MTCRGTVIRANEDGTADVVIVRGSACGEKCASCPGCGSKLNAMQATVANAPRARAGDVVTIYNRTGKVMGLAFVVFFLPVFLFFAGYIPLMNLSGRYAMIAGLAGFAAGMAVSVVLNRRMTKRKTTAGEIVEIARAGQNK